MSYFDGFVLAVPTANKQKFIDHANLGDTMFKDMGATRVVETWADDVPKGKVTDFQGAVQAQDDEAVVFSWIEWPDKATRDAGMAKMMSPDFNDERMDPEKNPMPFDGKRMIYGGFAPLLEKGHSGASSYTDGFVTPVPEDKRDAYREMADKAWRKFEQFGARRSVEAWGDDVPDGKQTDFRRAVKAEAGEAVVFSFIEWPDKATRDAGMAKMMSPDFNDERMDPEKNPMPFDGKRMFWGGFRPVVEL